MTYLVVSVNEEAFFREMRGEQRIDFSRPLLIEPTAVRTPAAPGRLLVEGKFAAYPPGNLVVGVSEDEKLYGESIEKFYLSLVPHASERRKFSRRQIRRLLAGKNRAPGSDANFHHWRIITAILRSHSDLVKVSEPIGELWITLSNACPGVKPHDLDPELRVMRDSFIEQARALERQPWGLALESTHPIVEELAQMVRTYGERASATVNVAPDYTEEQDEFLARQRELNAFFAQKARV